MVQIAQRMRRLRTLLAIRIGPGAAVLPPTVSRIHMDFAVRINQGHRGPRHFWRHMLPRLKYHNPAVPMTISRTEDQTAPATLSVWLRDSTFPPNPNPASSEAPTPTSAERLVTIDMKNKSENEILDAFLATTQGTPVYPTPEEKQLALDIEEYRAKSLKDSLRAKAVREAELREKKMLEMARGAV
ncbi:50S ribosomal protein-like protein Mrp49 [Trichodelitschia bisporula]|uniref:50S ribosomal protein-like protein Mrp49 n=1 Tax=Trichodelitschia bisporula TaxID=703511 RepID=A0A6G1I9M1_9PEZI|nr:50S ribosomal protein-like protein Mrp49 [Trichodelitschia bisporula]